jgi:hypothetical protein
VAEPFLRCTREKQESAERQLMMYKPFILLLGIFLGSHRPAVAQTPPPRIALAREQVAPVLSVLATSILSTATLSTATLPTVSSSIRFPLFSFRLFRDPERNSANFSHQLTGAYQGDYSLAHLSPMNEVRTGILTQSSLPLVQFWGGRLELDAFQSTLHLESGQLGLIGTGGMRNSLLSGQSYPGGPRSLHLSGLSLNIRFGREAQSGHPAQLWRRLTGIVGALLN